MNILVNILMTAYEISVFEGIFSVWMVLRVSSSQPIGIRASNIRLELVLLATSWPLSPYRKGRILYGLVTDVYLYCI